MCWPGASFATLEGALRGAAAVPPGRLARFLQAELECDSLEPSRCQLPAITSAAAELAALPEEAPLPLSGAVPLCSMPDGYIPAAAQSALLQTYGGPATASSAQTLAAEARDAFDAGTPPRHGRRRARRRRRAERAQASDTDNGSGVDAHDRVPTCPAPASAVAEDAWRTLDAVDLESEFRHPVPTLQDVPPFMRAALRGALMHALARLHAETERDSHDEAARSRAWKLFLLAPRMLLARPKQRGAQGRAELLGRAEAFQRGAWQSLLQSARHHTPSGGQETLLSPEEVVERKRELACAKVRKGEVSRARQVLTAAEIAPGDDATWAALTDPARRPAVPRTAVPQELLDFHPAELPLLSVRALASALREARRGGAPGLSGMRAEHLKVLIQDVPAMELLAEAATKLAQARLPAAVARALAMARVTALRKPDGGVRGIATGDVFRRLVSRTLAKEWAQTFDQATRPYQFALQARAGTDALAAHIRAALATRPDAVVVSLDGRSAYDCMSRAAFLGKLRQVAPELLPFVRHSIESRQDPRHSLRARTTATGHRRTRRRCLAGR